MKPLLKITGGKKHLAPYIADVYARLASKYNKNITIVEPFAGSLAISCMLEARRVQACELNPGIYAFHNEVKNGNLGEQLSRQGDLRLTEREYYRIRGKLNAACKTEYSSITAIAFYYYLMNKNCFNGLTRFNSKGEFNVPYGDYKRIPNDTDWREYKKLYKDWEIVHCDFADYESNYYFPKLGLYVLDPPYDGGFSAFCKEGFSWDDQLRLANWSYYVAKENPKSPVIVCNSPTQRILNLYKAYGFKRINIMAPRNISCKKDGRKPVKEVLFVRNMP